MRTLVWGALSGALCGALSIVACGGTAVVDGGSSGQGGSTGNGTSSRATSTGGPGPMTSTSTGSSTCDDHGDCPGGVCIFATGFCAPACSGDFCETCGPGLICNSCATSSCPQCADCMPACLPITSGQCDEQNPCPPSQTCVFFLQQCATICSSDENCQQDNEYCDQCATGSCCGCKNCVAACVGSL